MKFIFSILILLGILLIFLPSLQERYYDWQQAQVMDELDQLQSGLNKVNQSFDHTEQYSSADRAIKQEEPSMDLNALGVIMINKINVKLPILEDATEQNMKVAAAHLVETAPLGSEGNAAIAAHRAHKAGRLFNRLGELEVGDSIEVVLADQSHIHYTIDQIMIVEPTDVSVLQDPHLGQVLTLITCDPLINPTHRLIVRAVQQVTDHHSHT